MPKYFASFQEEKGGDYTALTPLRSRIAEVKIDVARPRIKTGKQIVDGTLVLIFRRTRKNPIIHGIYKWVNNGFERHLVRMGNAKLAIRLQALIAEE